MQIGNGKAVRAVGAASGKNPISIIAPCHRVIGTSGDLTGFAGGLATKKLLLTLESGDTLQPSFECVAQLHRELGNCGGSASPHRLK